MTADTKYYHGGRSGFKNGNVILPPSVTKTKRTTARFGNDMCDITKVYVTTDFQAAVMYAASVRGDVYQVQPVGALEHDPDCFVPGLSYSCERAVVVGVLRLNDREREQAMRVLQSVVNLPERVMP